MRNEWLAASLAAMALALGSTVAAHQEPPDKVTRTQGFFKTHEQALSACLARGAVDLGFVTLTTLEEGLGLLWGNPARFEDGGARGTLDKSRFLLARQTLVGTCNQRLFGTWPTPRHLLRKAVRALGDTDCEDLRELLDDVTSFNESGEDEPFPSGFHPGPSTPQHARRIAKDPTRDSGEHCTSGLDSLH